LHGNLKAMRDAAPGAFAIYRRGIEHAADGIDEPTAPPAPVNARRGSRAGRGSDR
jgi:hypothetical protein